jgi:hypothetical protein
MYSTYLVASYSIGDASHQSACSSCNGAREAWPSQISSTGPAWHHLAGGLFPSWRLSTNPCGGVQPACTGGAGVGCGAGGGVAVVGAEAVQPVHHHPRVHRAALGRLPRLPGRHPLRQAHHPRRAARRQVGARPAGSEIVARKLCVHGKVGQLYDHKRRTPFFGEGSMRRAGRLSKHPPLSRSEGASGGGCSGGPGGGGGQWSIPEKLRTQLAGAHNESQLAAVQAGLSRSPVVLIQARERIVLRAQHCQYTLLKSQRIVLI